MNKQKVHPNSQKYPKRSTKLIRRQKATKIGHFLQNIPITNERAEKKQQTRTRATTTVLPTKRSVILKITNHHGQLSAGRYQKKRARFAERILKIVNKADISCNKAISCETFARVTGEVEQPNKVPVIIYRRSREVVDPTKCQLKNTVRQLRVRVRVKTKHTNKVTFIRKNHLTSTGTLKIWIQISTGENPVKKQTNQKVGIFLILITCCPYERISQKLIINLSGRKMGFEDWKDTCPPKEVPEKILEDADVGESEHQSNQTGETQKENTKMQDTKLPSPPNTPLDFTSRQRKSPQKTPHRRHQPKSGGQALTRKKHQKKRKNCAKKPEKMPLSCQEKE